MYNRILPDLLSTAILTVLQFSLTSRSRRWCFRLVSIKRHKAGVAFASSPAHTTRFTFAPHPLPPVRFIDVDRVTSRGPYAFNYNTLLPNKSSPPSARAPLWGIAFNSGDPDIFYERIMRYSLLSFLYLARPKSPAWETRGPGSRSTIVLLPAPICIPLVN